MLVMLLHLFQNVEVCQFSENLLERYLDKKGGEKLSAFETLVLARLPCFELDDNNLFDRFVER
jgi:hypothetical protein